MYTVVNFTERSCKKKVDPSARAISARACPDCIAFIDRVDPSGQAKVLSKHTYGKKVGQLVDDPPKKKL